MSTIVTRAGKGSPLTHAEVDANFTNLNADKLESGDNVSALTNDAGYTTNVGDITGVTAGAGISGGGTSGTVTVSHADTSTQASVNNSGATVIQDVTVDTYGHITALGSVTITPATVGAATSAQGSLADSALQSGDNVSALTNDAGYTTNVGDITGVTAGAGISGGGTSGTVTVSHADTSTQASVNNSGATFIQDVTLDTYGHVTNLTSASVPAPTTSQVLSGTAGASVGSVGSYAWVVSTATNTTTLVPGSTIAGSGLYYGGVNRYSGWAVNSNSVYLDNGSETGLNAYNASTLSGTWRLMGNPRSYDANRGFGTLALRIS